MADEQIIETAPPAQVPSESRSNERITELSDKVRTTAEERDAATARAAEAERKAAFAEGFVDVVTTHPSAKDHKDEIRAKVLNGYSVQDATFAVLGAAGKLGGTSAPTPQVAGGSASTVTPQGGQKEVKDMSQAERRDELSKIMMWS